MGESNETLLSPLAFMVPPKIPYSMKWMRIVGPLILGALALVSLQAVVHTSRAADLPLVAGSSTVLIQPRTTFVERGESFTVSVMVEDADDMVGYRFQMNWDSSVLTVTDVVDAGFLLEPPLTSLDRAPAALTWEALVFPNPVPPLYDDGADGDGALAVITLQAIGEGTSALDLDGTKVEWYDAADPTFPHIPTVADGTVVVDGRVVYLPLVSRWCRP